MADPFADDDAFNPLSQARAPDATPAGGGWAEYLKGPGFDPSTGKMREAVAPTAPAPDTGGQSRRIEQLLSQGQGHIDKAEQSMNAESNIYQDKANALAPVRQKMMDLAAQPLPQPPQMQQPPAAPKRNDQHDDENWLMASALLGSLAGAFTRRHQTNALAAFGGAMEGYNEGSRQKFDQNMKIWEAENKAALEKNQQAMEHYRSIIENRKLTMEQMSVSLQMAAAQYDDQAMATAARTKNEIVIAQLYDKQAQAFERVQQSSDNLTLKYQQMQQKEKVELLKAAAKNLGIGTDPSQIQARVDAIGQLRAPPPQGRWAQPIMEMVYEQYAGQDKDHPVYDATKYQEKQRTVNTFANGIEGRQVGSLNVAISHLEVLKGLGEALQNHDVPRINQFGNMVAAELGYPAPVGFDAVKEVVSAEIMKAIVAGGGGVQERRSLGDKISAANSPAQLNQVIESWQALLAGQMEGLKRRYQVATGANDFDKFLAEQTHKALTQPFVPESVRETTKRITAPMGERLGQSERYAPPAAAIEQGHGGVDVNWAAGVKPLFDRKALTNFAVEHGWLPKGWQAEEVK